jgi:immune inhibitor A
MRRVLPALTALAVAAVLPVVAPPAEATPASAPLGSKPTDSGVTRLDNRATPAASRQAAQRQTAVQQLMSGDAELHGKGRARTIAMADGTEVSYPASQHAKLLTFLVDFGSGEGNPNFPTQTAGPVHNQIPEPGPSDNSTYWKSSFDRQHYLDMFFDGLDDQDGQSFKGIYNEMSSGQFDVSGDVSDWVGVDHPSSYYSQADGHESAQDMADFVGDSATAWFADATATMSDQQVRDYLAGFDQWDRYDADNDGNFNEPDGYIDHFQAIHAGPGEEAGSDPWTIWSHRSGAAFDPAFSTGPDCVSTTADPCFLPGGVEIGDTGYWIFDYTTEPENGGLGVFAHEFGHDLGLPDYYDTDAPPGVDNSTGFWNLMSSGSWLADEGHAPGTTPNHVSAYDKYSLGWYGPGDKDLQVADGLADEATTVTLGPSYHATTTGKQAVRVDLPDGEETLEGPVADSDDGAYLYSDNRSSSDALATSPAVEVPDVSQPMLSAKVAYDTEQDFDYVYLWVYDVESETWSPTPIETSESTDDNPELANLGNGITGSSNGWVDLTADLSAYAGKTVRLQWEYLTDPGTLGAFGFALDEISLGDYSTGFDVPVVDWALTGGFTAVRDNEYSITYPQAYFIENRQYTGYDSTLTSGPYSWGHNVSEVPYTVSDRFPYQDGLLVWYVNGRYGDNNTTQHPGGGVTLPVDASAAGQLWRDDEGDPLGLVDSRLQGFDATFDVDQTDALELDMELQPGLTGSLDVPAHPSIPVFDDSVVDGYYDDSLQGSEVLSTKVAGTGAMVQVVSSDEETGEMVVKIGKRFVAATSAAAIDGDESFGGTLTATPPTWFQDDVTATVAWLRDGAPIGGADGTEYELTAADVGHIVSAEITGSKDGYQDTTVATNTIAAVADPAPEPSTQPSVAGTTQVGQTLTAHAAEWPLDGSSTFAWSVDGQSRNTGTTYVVRPEDLGHPITLTETFSSPGHEDATATVGSAAITKGTAPHATVAPAFTGTAQVGERLAAVKATWPVAGESTFAWTVGGVLVGTGAAYVVAPADLGKPVTITETFASPGYDVATSAVATPAVILGAAPVATAQPRVSGAIRVGSTIKAVSGAWPLTGSSTFAWSVAGKTVGTGTSYAVRPADVGKALRLTETRTVPGYDSGRASTESVAVAKAPVKVSVAIGKAKRGKKVSVTVTAKSGRLTVPGKVTLTYAGRKVGSPTLKHGKLTVKLPAKQKGQYWLTLSYAGTSVFTKDGKTVAVKVK